MMKIGLFGGSFDPIHTGHLLVAQAATEQLGLDRMLFVPAARSPHKPSKVYASGEHRAAMIRAAIKGKRGWSCSTLELERSGPSFSVDTVRVVHDLYPKAHLFLLIGSDNLASFAAWKEPKAILGLSSVVVYARHGYPVTRRLMKRWHARLLRGSEIYMSSTDIRRRIAGGMTCRFFVPPVVERYVARHALYTS